MPKTRPTEPAPASEPAAASPKRMTLSAVVEHLLNRGPTDHSSVTLTRNAKGDTQIDVVVRTGDSGEVQTADQAAAKARELYDDLAAHYPRVSATPEASSS